MKVESREDLINLMRSTYSLKKSDFRGGYITKRLIRDDEDIDLRGCVFYKCYIQDEPKGAIIVDSVSNLNKIPYYFKDLNLEGFDLEGLDLSRLIFRGVNFKNANLRNVNFTGSVLSKANFDGATIEGVVLHGANLAGLIRREEDICQSCNSIEDSEPTYLKRSGKAFLGYACDACRQLCIYGCGEYTDSFYNNCLNCGLSTIG